MQSLFVLACLTAGGVLAIQVGANAQLSKATGSAFSATAMQLAIATLVLYALAAATGTVGALRGLDTIDWWHAIGGVASALYVLSTILLFPRLGAVVTVGLYIAGQMFASLALDASGAFGVPLQTVSAAQIAGAVAVLAGVAAIVAGQSTREGVQGALAQPVWVVLALVAGALLPVQGAINALLRSDLQAPFAAGVVSFVVATVAMLLTLPGAARLSGAPLFALRGLRGMPWWGWLGGVAGATYVTTVFSAIPVIGTSATVALTVAGQQVASMLVDGFGLLRFPQRKLSPLRIAGVAMLLLGVALIQLF
jgi:bacterial/archaeal transporter family-2 protein